MPVNAAERFPNYYSYYNQVFRGKNIGIQFKFPKGTKFSSLKSSAKDVVTVKSGSYKAETKDEDCPAIIVTEKRPGIAYISFIAQIGNRKKTYSILFNLKNWENPIKEFKIGTKNYTSKFRSGGYYTIGKNSNVKGKLYIEAAEDWNITSITQNVALKLSNVKGKGGKYKIKHILNGSNVRVNKRNYGICVSLRNKYTWESRYCIFRVNLGKRYPHNLVN